MLLELEPDERCVLPELVLVERCCGWLPDSRFTVEVRPVESVVLIVVRVSPLMVTRVFTLVEGCEVC